MNADENETCAVAMRVKFSLSPSKRLCRNLFSTAAPHEPDLVSYYFSLLHSSPNAQHLQHLHARLLRNALFSNVVLSSKLILMYSKHNNLLPHSVSVFLHMPHRNTYSWNIMIGEFSRSGLPTRSIQVFVEMLRSGAVAPDHFNLPLVLRACASLRDGNTGMAVHGSCLKLGFEKNVFVASALVYFYVAILKVCRARKVFDEMSDRDAVLWTSMLGGYAQNGEPVLALEVFREMVGEEIELDDVVMISLLLVCSQLGWPRPGKSVHAWIIRRRLGLGLNLGNALVDVYVKCGELSYAQRVFDRMPERDVISWSALIVGYGFNGQADFASYLFEMMIKEGVRPNSVTFLGVLSACCHNGMVEKAWSFFNLMKEYEVVSELKHYACMADVLGRAGLLVEAERFIDEMPIEPDGAVLGALLGGCRVHGNVEVGERVAKRLIGLEPERSGYYVLLANIYAAVGRFDDADRVREFMKERKVEKVPGWSLIEGDGHSHSLPSKKTSHGLISELKWRENMYIC